jgi:hypothetical protein
LNLLNLDHLKLQRDMPPNTPVRFLPVRETRWQTGIVHEWFCPHGRATVYVLRDDCRIYPVCLDSGDRIEVAAPATK